MIDRRQTPKDPRMIAPKLLRPARTLLTAGLALGFLVLAAPAADPPPTADEVAKLLEQEPVDKANWPAWKKRLEAWAGQPTDFNAPAVGAARPAFEAAQKYVEGEMPGGKWKKGSPVEKDAVAHLAVGVSIMTDTKSSKSRLARAEEALKWFDGSLKHDKNLAAAKLWAALAVRQ